MSPTSITAFSRRTNWRPLIWQSGARRAMAPKERPSHTTDDRSGRWQSPFRVYGQRLARDGLAPRPVAQRCRSSGPARIQGHAGAGAARRGGYLAVMIRKSASNPTMSLLFAMLVSIVSNPQDARPCIVAQSGRPSVRDRPRADSQRWSSVLRCGRELPPFAAPATSGVG